MFLEEIIFKISAQDLAALRMDLLRKELQAVLKFLLLLLEFLLKTVVIFFQSLGQLFQLTRSRQRVLENAGLLAIL